MSPVNNKKKIKHLIILLCTQFHLVWVLFIYFICDENLIVFHIVTQGKWTLSFGKVK